MDMYYIYILNYNIYIVIVTNCIYIYMNIYDRNKITPQVGVDQMGFKQQTMWIYPTHNGV